MASEPAKTVPSSYPSPNRLWAEQLAIGMGLLLVLLVFMAIFHQQAFASGAAVLGKNDMNAYGWMSGLGVLFQVVIHELGTLFVAWRWGLPLKFRFFGLGWNASAILQPLPRKVWTDAVIGSAGPLTGTAASLILAGIYEYTRAQDVEMHLGNPLFLGMACVGYFYNLFTLIPILDLEGGWIAPAISPQAWLCGLIACALELSYHFNLVLLCILAFGVPRFFLIIRARAPRTDTGTSTLHSAMVSTMYFALVLGLTWFSSTTFETLPELVRASMGD